MYMPVHIPVHMSFHMLTQFEDAHACMGVRVSSRKLQLVDGVAGTLDYIFCSGAYAVEVLPTPSSADAG